MCCTDESDLNDEVCPSGRIPYLINGLPQRCTSQRCPRGFECTYKGHDYICCSSVGKNGRHVSPTPTSAFKYPLLRLIVVILPAKDQCSQGSALIYPSTRMPVICIPGKKGCPPGYGCKKSISSDQYVCCSSRFRMSASSGPPCEGYMVLVSRIINGKVDERCGPPCEGYMVLVSRIINGKVDERCERSCPYLQVPIGGICYEMRSS
ncbi:unnamed protein product [Strongylus vulgaris]|uniref:EB domain-containing protein n=1 Tax=Strongylus vulgaris TaxID=40348 RepID=A0A3P7L9T8_STRVU|nr:unnamed protein product [Strongylus vulgaris]